MSGHWPDFLLSANLQPSLTLYAVPVMFQSVWRSFYNLKDVGMVQVKVIRAEGLMAADVTGKTVTVSLNISTTGSGQTYFLKVCRLLFHLMGVYSYIYSSLMSRWSYLWMELASGHWIISAAHFFSPQQSAINLAIDKNQGQFWFKGWSSVRILRES